MARRRPSSKPAEDQNELLDEVEESEQVEAEVEQNDAHAEPPRPAPETDPAPEPEVANEPEVVTEFEIVLKKNAALGAGTVEAGTKIATIRLEPGRSVPELINALRNAQLWK